MVHVVENLADTAFRSVVVELLPAGALRRGDDPKVIAGEASIVQRLGEERAAILAVDIKAKGLRSGARGHSVQRPAESRISWRHYSKT